MALLGLKTCLTKAMWRFQMSKRFQLFLIWTLVTCVLLGIQRLIFEDTTVVFQPSDEPTQHEDESPQPVPFQPFEAGQPKMLVVLTYQRSGSTFFGKMFNKNPNVFYSFEPLDAFYSSYYGTPVKWNVPSDITSYKNGTERILPANEVRAVSQFLASLLSCDVGQLPPEALLHPYIYYYKTDEYQGAGDFIRCIEKYQSLVTQCSARSPRTYCGDRFGEMNETRLADCHKALHDEHYRNSHKRKAVFEKYVMCMRSLKRIVSKKCLQLLQKKCDQRQLRVAKTVRGTMDSMELILRQVPNFRVIHLIRDPRAVVLSRREFDPSVRSIYATADLNNTMSREAQLLCRTVARDIRLRLELEQKYPGRLYQVVYDEMVRDLQKFAKNIYHFLNYSNPEQASWWKQTITPMKSKESVRRADKWQTVITFDQNAEIMKHCRELFRLVKSQHWQK